MEICFLEPENVVKNFPLDVEKFFLDKKYFSLTVRSEPHYGLQIKINRDWVDTVRRTEIENWGVPEN